MQDKVKEVVSAAITLGTLSIPGFSDWINAVGGQAEVFVLTGALWRIIHGIVDKVHAGAVKIAALPVVLALLLPVPAMAQEPAPDRGAVWINYNLENAEPGMDHLAGFSAEADATVKGTPLSIVGHVSRHSGEMSTVTYAALGPRVTKTFGALRVYGHYLYGNASIGMDDSKTMDGMMTMPGGGLMPVSALEPNNHRRGGGIMIPFGSGGEVRIGADHDGKSLYSTVGVGWRF